MTTTSYRGKDPQPDLLSCPLGPTASGLTLAVRAMREANGRIPETGEGVPNDSLDALSRSMTVLDVLSGTSGGVGARLKGLLQEHGVKSEDDRTIIVAVRNSMLHEYGVPTPEDAARRQVVYANHPDGYALDTDTNGKAVLSVPVFCAWLVEGIVSARGGKPSGQPINLAMDPHALGLVNTSVAVTGSNFPGQAFPPIPPASPNRAQRRAESKRRKSGK